MDGNGRWAQDRKKPRSYGHLRGARTAKDTIEACAELKIERLTLYAFSTENWLRPKDEVGFLMSLLARHLRKERENLIKNNIRFETIGCLKQLPTEAVNEVELTKAATAHCSGMTLTFALSYGGRQDIVRAAQRASELALLGKLKPEQITEEVFEELLDTRFEKTYTKGSSGYADPDLLIRTSGESRLSNFMLWQCAYSEIYIEDIHWPDFKRDRLLEALAWFQTRERRFGKTSLQVTTEHKSSYQNIENSLR